MTCDNNKLRCDNLENASEVINDPKAMENECKSIDSSDIIIPLCDNLENADEATILSTHTNAIDSELKYIDSGDSKPLCDNLENTGEVKISTNEDKSELNSTNYNEIVCNNSENDGEVTTLTSQDTKVKESEQIKSNTRRKTIITTCGFCKYEATKGRGTLKCTSCLQLIHFECTQLPPYMVYTLSSTKRQYTCAECANPTEEFLRAIIDRSIVGVSSAPAAAVNSQSKCPESLRAEISEIHEYIEKYDLPKIVNKIEDNFNKINAINNRIVEHLNKLEKKTLYENNSSINNKELSMQITADSNHQINELGSKIEKAEEEIRSYKAAEKILIESIDGKDKKIMNLYNDKERHMNTINEKHKMIQILEEENKTLKDVRDRCQKLESENVLFQGDIDKGNETILDRENLIKTLYERCTTADVKEEANGGIIASLKTQLKAYSDRVTDLESKIDQSRKETPTQPDEGETTAFHSIPFQPKVLLFHDSMCGKINETVCSRENIEVKKVWAPHIRNVLDEIDNIQEPADAIVIHTLTNDLVDNNVDDMVEMIAEAVDKGLNISKKIVVSTIIDRDDDRELNTKAHAVNANLKYKFMNNQQVVICSNDNLRDKKFRKDQVHLTDRGISRLANNLKYKIAAAVGISVKPKEAGKRYGYQDYRREYREDRQNYRNDDYSSSDRNRSDLY